MKYLILLMDNPDIVLCICGFLSDTHIVRFLSCNNKLNLLKNRVLFRKKRDILKIHDLPYFDRFVSVSIKDLSSKLPIQIKHLTIVGMKTSDIINFSFPEELEKIDIGNCYWDSEYPKFPKRTRELLLCRHYSFMIPTLKPKSPFTPNMELEILTMGTLECEMYSKTIPTNVSKLVLHNNAYKPTYKIPYHITHLEFESWNNNHGDTKIIPETVQYLRIHYAQRFHVSSISHRKMTLYLPGHWEEECDNIPLGPDFKIVYDRVKPF